MKKVLCVIMTKFFEGGGLTSVMMNYYRELWSNPNLSEQFTIDFLSHDSITPELQAEIESHGSTYYSIPGRRDNPIGHYHELSKILRRNQYDVLHFNCNSGMDALELVVAKRFVPNRICHIHCSSPKYPFAHLMLKGLMNRAYTQAVAVSQDAGDWMFGRETNYIILNNAIKTDRFAYDEEKRREMRDRIGISDSTFVVGNVGRMSSNNPKNHGYLIEAFAAASEVNENMRLMIIGDGALLDRWKDLTKRLGIEDRVIFEGFKTNIDEYMQAFDLFCFPSQSEGLGMVAIEAQASGLPCMISSEVPKEVELAESIERIGITHEEMTLWSSTILSHSWERDTDRGTSSLKAREAIKAGGYDVTTEVLKLINLYNM